MIKILHTADWHIGRRQGPVTDGVNLREKDTELCVERVAEAAEVEQPDITMVSGDLIDAAGTYSERGHYEERVVFRAVSRIAEASKYVVVLRGTPNHDGEEFFRALSDYCRQFGNVSTVMEPMVVSTEFMDIACIPGFDIGYYRAKRPGLPKDEENAAFSSELDNICIGLKALCSPELPSALMAHYTVPGCNTESGQSTFLQQFEPVLSPDALHAARYDIVCLGHIHRPQKLPNVPNTFYSGAVNALNFNDEGQKRGFWIHGFEDSQHIDSRFMDTPYREFITLHLDADDIRQINNGALDMVAAAKWPGKVENKIVRIFYDCTEADKKAFNRALVEKKLLADGAFMLWDIAPRNIAVGQNKKGLGKRSDPEENLREYLEERGIPGGQIPEIIKKAEPIIGQVLANGNHSILAGEFEPVSIQVRNYRNYAEEAFDFGDISFCTINGANGAGKSSLFMDAILDCLYEQPREGSLTGWIRDAEGVRSGNITFTFRIGEQMYRVSRSRTKSKALTLGLSEKVNGEWENRTCSKSAETQKKIEQLLGMDCTTFKSCALIMQDQYGLFLQADKKERMGILSRLLGLEIYDAMNKSAAELAKEYGVKKRDAKHSIEMHEATLKLYGEPEKEIEGCASELELLRARLDSETAARDRHKLALTHQLEAIERKDKLEASIAALQDKKDAAERNKAAQQAVIDSCAAILGGRAEIEEKVSEHKSLLKRERELAGESALYSSKKQEAENLARQAEAEQKAVADLQRTAQAKQDEKNAMILDSANDGEVRQKAELYAGKKAELDEMQEKAAAYQKAKAEYDMAVFRHDEITRKFDAEKQSADRQKRALEKKVEILSESGCVDIDNAHCKFLQDAIEAKEELAALDGIYEDIAARRETELAESELAVEEKSSAMDAAGFDAGALPSLREKCAALLPYVSKLEDIKQRESKAALLEADIKHLQSNILEAEKRLSEARLKRTEAGQERDRCAEAFEGHKKVLASIVALEPWLDKEKQLPVAEERKATAMERAVELSTEISGIATEITEKQADIRKEEQAIGDTSRLKEAVSSHNQEIAKLGEQIGRVQQKIGSLLQKAEDAKRIHKEVGLLRQKVNEYAMETADYDILKDAFSYFGIPHQIVRSILPQMESTANQIMGQMTGGKMGISFRTEGAQGNNRKEVLELDVLIEEYGKSVLPYLSKSGGEKVKASLSVILALSEIKSSSAGIQLGMLFIDEPPFLDGDGAQAYCDALEAIHNRYKNIKIMAITHDPAMKARFPQSLDVAKTDTGSRVVY